jgi:hypothetical protein
VDKTNFLAVYGRAHVQALTRETIKSAFHKTGAWPFDPGAITAAQMAPSIETSTRYIMPLQVVQPSPIHTVAAMFLELAAPIVQPPTYRDLDTDDDMDMDLPQTPSPLERRQPTIPSAVRSSFNNLASTSAAFLLSPSRV